MIFKLYIFSLLLLKFVQIIHLFTLSYFSFEILHARWAMLASLGALIPEILDIFGAFHFTEPIWWRVGYSKLKVCFPSPGQPSLWIFITWNLSRVSACFVSIFLPFCLVLQLLFILLLLFNHVLFWSLAFHVCLY